MKCQRLVDYVYPVVAFGSENWSWTIQTSERIKGWETKTMLCLFRFRHKEGTWVAYHTRTCNVARKIWIQIGLLFLFERISEKYVASHGMGL